ncbi:hybrid polyketide synthetase [Balamuthia mandrillaris]
MKYFLIADEGGNPIYSDHPDGTMLCLLLVNTNLMMKQNFGKRFASMTCGSVRFVLEQFEQLSFMVVSDQGESEIFLRSQLRQIFDQLLMLFGPKAIVEAKSQHFKKHRKTIQHMVDAISNLSDTHQSMLVRAVERLEVDDQTRTECFKKLKATMKKEPLATYGILFVGTKLLVSYSKPKTPELDPTDVLLLINYFKATFHPQERNINEKVLPVADYTDHSSLKDGYGGSAAETSTLITASSALAPSIVDPSVSTSLISSSSSSSSSSSASTSASTPIPSLIEANSITEKQSQQQQTEIELQQQHQGSRRTTEDAYKEFYSDSPSFAPKFGHLRKISDALSEFGHSAPSGDEGFVSASEEISWEDRSSYTEEHSFRLLNPMLCHALYRRIKSIARSQKTVSASIDDCQTQLLAMLHDASYAEDTEQTEEENPLLTDRDHALLTLFEAHMNKEQELSGDGIILLQEMLQLISFYPGKTDSISAEYKLALILFQESCGVHPTGELDISTALSLLKRVRQHFVERNKETFRGRYSPPTPSSSPLSKYRTRDKDKQALNEEEDQSEQEEQEEEDLHKNDQEEEEHEQDREEDVAGSNASTTRQPGAAAKTDWKRADTATLSSESSNPPSLNSPLSSSPESASSSTATSTREKRAPPPPPPRHIPPEYQQQHLRSPTEAIKEQNEPTSSTDSNEETVLQPKRKRSVSIGLSRNRPSTPVLDEEDTVATPPQPRHDLAHKPNNLSSSEINAPTLKSLHLHNQQQQEEEVEKQESDSDLNSQHHHRPPPDREPPPPPRQKQAPSPSQQHNTQQQPEEDTFGDEETAFPPFSLEQPFNPENSTIYRTLYLRVPQYESRWVYCAELARSITLVIVMANGTRNNVAKGTEEEMRSLNNIKKQLSSMIRNYATYLITKEHTHLPVLSFLHQFPGLVHFLFVDRTFNRVIAPPITALHGREYKTRRRDESLRLKLLVKEKVWDMVYLSQERLSEGYHSMLMKKGAFQYSYRLWMEDTEDFELPFSSDSAIVGGTLPSRLPQNHRYYTKITRRKFAGRGGVRCYELYTLYLGMLSVKTVLHHDRNLVSILLDRKTSS